MYIYISLYVRIRILSLLFRVPRTAVCNMVVIPQTFTVTSEHIRFLLFSFSVLHFLVVVSVR